MFYENLKRVCDKKRTTPTAVAEAIGMSRSNATEWKKGKSPKLSTVLKIADYLNVSAASLIRKTSEKEETA